MSSTIRVLRIRFAAVLAGAAAACAPVTTAQSSRASAAEDSIRSIAATIGGQIGVAALHVESGRRLEIEPQLPVFMSSVVKLPIAVQLLDRVDRRELSLDHRIALGQEQYRPGHSPLAARWPEGVTLTVRELLGFALSESDNSASDALLAYSGGPAEVTRRLRTLGAPGIRVDRGYFDYVLDFTGTRLATRTGWTAVRLDSATRASPPAARDSGAAAFAADVRDRASARALVDLLARIARGEILSDSSRALLLRITTESNNPRGRMVAGVPAGTRVAHKTGTWGASRQLAAVNDVGLISLPDGTALAVALLSRNATRPLPEVESALASITQLIYTWATGGR